MIPVPADRFGAFVGWLLESSFEASLLICAIFAVQLLGGRRISARWRHALWFLVLLRLALPWTPQSRFSIYSVVPRLIQRSPVVGSF